MGEKRLDFNFIAVMRGSIYSNRPQRKEKERIETLVEEEVKHVIILHNDDVHTFRYRLPNRNLRAYSRTGGTMHFFGTLQREMRGKNRFLGRINPNE